MHGPGTVVDMLRHAMTADTLKKTEVNMRREEANMRREVNMRREEVNMGKEEVNMRHLKGTGLGLSLGSPCRDALALDAPLLSDLALDAPYLNILRLLVHPSRELRALKRDGLTLKPTTMKIAVLPGMSLSLSTRHLFRAPVFVALSTSLLHQRQLKIMPARKAIQTMTVLPLEAMKACEVV